jgi:hypothetical protein
MIAAFGSTIIGAAVVVERLLDFACRSLSLLSVTAYHDHLVPGDGEAVSDFLADSLGASRH